jgi:alpha-ketoglutarate-dependent taurine dioxygenase
VKVAALPGAFGAAEVLGVTPETATQESVASSLRAALAEHLTHPIVRAQPVTGAPALYIDLDRATSIVGMEEGEGRAILRSLQEHAEATAPMYAHDWRDHDVVVWDNASVQHRASGDFPVGEPPFLALHD